MSKTSSDFPVTMPHTIDVYVVVIMNKGLFSSTTVGSVHMLEADAVDECRKLMHGNPFVHAHYVARQVILPVEAQDAAS